MKRFQVLIGLLAVTAVSQSAIAQDFATGSSPWSRQQVADRYRSQTSTRNASYWVERDPRYVPSLPQVERMTYRPATDYDGFRRSYESSFEGANAANGMYQARYGATPGYGCSTASRYGGNGVPPVGPDYGAYPPRTPGYGPLPRNYYKGDGLFGKDTVYAKDQPIRNFFRYMMP